MRSGTRKGVLILAALAAAVSWSGYRYWTWKEAQAKKAMDGHEVAVERGPIEETVEVTGSVSPLNRVEIKPPISGRMENLLVEEGDHVKAGQIIAWMSSLDRAAILDAARAQGPEVVKRWEDAYKPTPILAPLSGLIILKNVVVGQTVDPTVVVYAMSDVLIVIASVDESDIGRVHIGMPARITLDAYPDRSDTGTVFDILYEGKNVSNVITYQVKIKLPHVPSFYRSQMTADINFVVRKKTEALLVPAVAVREAGRKGKQVTWIGPDGQPAPREITTGIETTDKVEVLSGLSEGDRVLIERGHYAPQQAPQTSPLTFGGNKPQSSQSQGAAANHRPR